MNAVLHLRETLERFARLVETDDYEQLIEADRDPVVIEALVEAFVRADEYLTGKSNPRHQYEPHVRALLTGTVWHWHLADGGYSRITASIIDGVDRVLAIDLGLSREPVKARWFDAVLVWRVIVGNESYLGSYLGDFPTEESAERAAQVWLWEMLATDGETPEDYPEGDHGYEWVIERRS
jgi:hypothetical protein